MSISADRSLIPARAIGYSKVATLMYIPALIGYLLISAMSAEYFIRLGDFPLFYAVSEALMSGSPYDLNNIARYVGSEGYPFHYPPTALFFISPLQYMPFVKAFIAWSAIGLLAWLITAKIALPWRGQEWWLVLAAPVVPLCIICGQNGLFTASFVVAGILAAKHRPATSGLLLAALACIKPHMVIVPVIALLAARYYRAFAALIGFYLCAAVGAGLIFGIDTWIHFFSRGSSAWIAMTGLSIDNMHRMVSVSGVLASWGTESQLITIIQMLWSVAVIALVGWLHLPQSKLNWQLRLAAIGFGVIAAAPFAFDYDTPIVTIAAFALLKDFERRQSHLIEVALIAALLFSPIVFALPAFGATFGNLTPILLAGGLIAVWRRSRI